MHAEKILHLTKVHIHSILDIHKLKLFFDEKT